MVEKEEWFFIQSNLVNITTSSSEIIDVLSTFYSSFECFYVDGYLFWIGADLHFAQSLRRTTPQPFTRGVVGQLWLAGEVG